MLIATAYVYYKSLSQKEALKRDGMHHQRKYSEDGERELIKHA